MEIKNMREPHQRYTLCFRTAGLSNNIAAIQLHNKNKNILL